MDVAFITSSLGTPWESVSQALIGMAFPRSLRLVLDGRKGWHPLNFVARALEMRAEWIVHIDEDAFLLDSSQLECEVRRMEHQPNAVLTGTPDGGTFHRHHNPCACNPFFLIMHRQKLTLALEKCPGWRELKWTQELLGMANPPLERLDSKLISYDDFEPFYSLYWAILNAGGKIRYLVPELEKGLFASVIRTDPIAPNPMLIHMWWLRVRKQRHVEPYLGVSHRERYRKLWPFLWRRITKRGEFIRSFVKAEFHRLARLSRSMYLRHAH